MNIDPKTGEIEIEKGGFVIRPDISKDEFLGSPTGSNARLDVENQQYTTYSFKFGSEPSFFGMSMVFVLQKLDSVRLEKLHPGRTWGNWSEAQELEHKIEHDHLLVSLLGKPPYCFVWGEIASLYDPRSGSANIIILYRRLV